MKPSFRAAAVALLLCAVCPAWAAQPGNARPTGTADAALETPIPPLRSRADLERWLAARAGMTTPLDALSPLARRRFLDSLVFGAGGVGGFAYDDLAMELTPDQARAVLALFGLGNYSERFQFRRTNDSPQAHPSDPGPIERDFDALNRASEDGRRFDADARSLYMSRFAPLYRRDVLQALPLRELLYALRGATLAAFTGEDPMHFGEVATAVQELERRGQATPADLRAAFDGLLVTRRFEEARAYAQRHAGVDLPALPIARDSLGADAIEPTVWRLDASGDTMRRVTMDLRPLQILVAAGCHFSVDAAGEIAADPVLGPVFKQSAHWLVLPPGREDFDAVRDWNRQFPDAPALMLHSRSEWSLLPGEWVMPTFFVVRDGEVLGEASGWSKRLPETRKNLIRLLKEHGLLPDSSKLP